MLTLLILQFWKNCLNNSYLGKLDAIKKFLFNNLKMQFYCKHFLQTIIKKQQLITNKKYTVTNINNKENEMFI